MNNQYNVWNKWDKLKTVVLGDIYKPEFYKDIKNTKVRDALLKITEESLEEISYFEKVLKDFGCDVLRPYVDPNDNIMNYLNANGKMKSIPRQPLQPRDAQAVFGNKIFYTTTEKPFEDLLDKYNSSDKVDLRHADKTEHRRSPKSEDIIHACSYTMVGKDIYIDQKDRALEEWQRELLEKNIKDVRINYINHGGHSDGCFHTIKNGALLSIVEIQKYPKTFPNWDVCYLLEEGKTQLSRNFAFFDFKQKVNGKWWAPGEEDNSDFTDFVERWLSNWVGFVEESVFDVNVLVLDEHHVCVSSLNPKVVDFLKRHKMEPILVPWRHRYFWDGGLHCLTLDLYREGKQEDYFPNRIGSVIDYGYDQYGRPYEMGV